MTPALWLALVAVVLPWVVHVAVVVAKVRGGYDANHPRDQARQLTGWAGRAWAAELNAFEAAPPAAVVFLVAHLTAVDPTWVTGLGAGWVAFRALHFGAYLGDVPPLRSAAFGLANLCLVGLVVLAAT